VSPKHILIVDDEFTSAEVLAVVLRDDGFRVTVASNGRQALDRLEEASPDLIVTDLMMPVMNGVEMARAVRARPRFARVPILLISSVAESALGGQPAAHDGFLRKPFGLDALIDAIRALLDRG